MKKVFLFRVDGGKVWGTSMGHVKRALLLAENLRNKYDIVFIMKDYKDGVDFVKKNDFEVVTISTDDNSDETLIELCEKYKPLKLIVDLKSCPYSRLFEYAHSKGINTIVFDVDGKFSSASDILINDSFVKEFTEYAGLPENTKKYLGPKYFVMEEMSNPIFVLGQVRDIMITMGGSDPAGLTVKIVRSISENIASHRFNIVLGPLFTERAKVRNMTKAISLMKVYDSPDDFMGLLGRQDIVITAAGRTLYECAFLGKPVITVPSIEHEETTAREYSSITGSTDIGLWEDSVSPGKLLGALKAYCDKTSLRKVVSEKSRGLIDGRGLGRVLEIIG